MAFYFLYSILLVWEATNSYGRFCCFVLFSVDSIKILLGSIPKLIYKETKNPKKDPAMIPLTDVALPPPVLWQESWVWRGSSRLTV